MKPAETTVRAKLTEGFASHEQGKLAEAERLYEEVLRRDATNFDALHLLGIIALQTQRAQLSVELIEKAINVNPKVADAYNHLGNGLKEIKRPKEALAAYDSAIALKPEFPAAYCNRGAAFRDMKLSREALASYDAAIALKPDYWEAYYNRGNALKDLMRVADALSSYDTAIALKPDFAESHYNRAIALSILKRREDALASYDLAIALKPDYADAHNNRGTVLSDLNRPTEALESYEKAVMLNDSDAAAHNNRGTALREMERNAEALASYDRAIALKPDYAEAYNNRGAALRKLNRLTEALSSYQRAIALKPDSEFLYGDLISIKMRLCDWRDLDSQVAQLVKKIDSAERASPPFAFLAMSGSPELHRKTAQIWADTKHPCDCSIPKLPRHPMRDKIRVGYFSADFREHPVAASVAELIERHDRSRFEVIALSLGFDTKDQMRKRLEAEFDRFIDLRNQSDREAALLVRRLAIDVAVDLGGFTAHSRTGIFAMQAAPVQVNYLGYPGTMSAAYMDYLIADSTLIPATEQRHYAEKIAYLPNSYMPNDSTRAISERMFDRAEFGLPQGGFVFCCFNSSYKLNPSVFDCWMRILRKVDRSVLWLSETNATVIQNLQKEAESRGIRAERLVFAKRVPLAADHLARHRLADLFLDTLPYNAHTTASDALWSGLPVLTCAGNAFQSRVAASLLNAICLPELITTTLKDYETVAIELATHPTKLGALKRKLSNNRLTAPLFDIQLFTRNIEAAYTAMHERYHAGLAPDHIFIP